MLPKLGLGLAALLILLIRSTTLVNAEDVPICRAQVAEEHGTEDADVPLPTQRPSAGECVSNGETRLGYNGFEHCRLHPYYQLVFPTYGCNCSTGQCRPTSWRHAPRTTENPLGMEIFQSGLWRPIPPDVLHKFYQNGPRSLPEPLMEYDAHICAFDNTVQTDPHTKKPVVIWGEIECAWVKEDSM